MTNTGQVRQSQRLIIARGDQLAATLWRIPDLDVDSESVEAPRVAATPLDFSFDGVALVIGKCDFPTVRLEIQDLIGMILQFRQHKFALQGQVRFVGELDNAMMRVGVRFVFAPPSPERQQASAGVHAILAELRRASCDAAINSAG